MLMPGDLTDSEPGWAQRLAAHGGDKVGHLLLFFGQSFWLSRLFAGSSLRPEAWRGPVLATIYGVLLESAQLLVPGRGFDALDLAANTLGALAWPLVAKLLERR